MNLTELKEILAIGIPASLVNIMGSYSTALTNRFLLPFGNEKIAALGISTKISMIATMIVVGFAYGAQSLIGYNYGRKNFERLNKILRFIYVFLIGLSAFMMIILGLSAPFLLRLFMDDISIVTAGVQILRNQLSGIIFAAIILVSSCTFQAAGKGTAALILCISRQGIIFTIVMCILNAVFGYQGVISAMPTADFLSAILSMVLMKKSLLSEMNSV